MPQVRTSRPGTSLIEAMVAMLVLVIGATGATYLFVYGRAQIRLRQEYRVAARLAAESLEGLKALEYGDIVVGETEEHVVVQDVSFVRKLKTSEAGPCRQADAAVSWGRSGNEHTIALTTLIGPK